MSFLLRSVAIMAVIHLATALPQLEKRACAVINPQARPVLASGYTATVVTKGLKTPREIIFDSLGQLLVVEQGGGGVRLIKLTDNGGTDVCVASSKTLINDATVSCTFFATLPHENTAIYYVDIFPDFRKLIYSERN